MDNSDKTGNGAVNAVNVMAFTPDFPQFAFYCPTNRIPYFSNQVTSMSCPGSTPGHPATCDQFITTDPGKGLITGKCADLGMIKVPILLGVGARAPYFHGGNALTLTDVVNFYNKRFNIGLTAQQKTDLVNYLNSL
jgi:cytochrome c peroxidase